MLGKPNRQTSSNGSNDIKPVAGVGQMRGEFEKSLSIHPKDVTPKKVVESRKKVGELKAYSITLAELADARTDEHKLRNKIYGQTVDYAVKAANSELEWQKTTNEAVQKIAPLMLKIQGEKAEEIGFNSYLPDGAKMLKY